MMFQSCFLAVERKPRMVAKSTALETQYMQVQLARAVPVQSRPRITPPKPDALRKGPQFGGLFTTIIDAFSLRLADALFLRR